jgi:riboflavin transporter FmnP
VALNLSPIKFPAPYLPFLYYQVWEIPIVVAFLLFGPITGVSVSIINTAALFVLFPGALPTGPIYNLIAVLSMLTGIYCARWLTRIFDKKQEESFFFFLLVIITVTLLGGALRVFIMSFVNWELIKYPPPIGFSMPEEVVIAILPFVALFNGSLAAYTVPAGYLLAKTISRGIKTPLWSP